MLANVVNQNGDLRLPYTFAGGEVLVFALQPWSPAQDGIFGAVVAQIFDYGGIAPLLTDDCLGDSWRLINGCRRLVMPVESEPYRLEIRPAARVDSYTVCVKHISGGNPQLVHAGTEPV